jgi:hypothetical protein
LGLPAFNREACMSRTYYIYGRDTDYVDNLEYLKGRVHMEKLVYNWKKISNSI